MSGDSPERLDVDSYRLGLGTAIHVIDRVISRVHTDPGALAGLTVVEVLGRVSEALRGASADMTGFGQGGDR